MTQYTVCGAGSDSFMHTLKYQQLKAKASAGQMHISTNSYDFPA